MLGVFVKIEFLDKNLTFRIVCYNIASEASYVIFEFSRQKSTFGYFSNYQTLNPEVKYFEILDESHGKDGKWTYGVHYVEYFEHLPEFFENSAIGRYTVSSTEELYTIESEHITCMIPILNWFCLKTNAKDTLEPWHQDCVIKEEINFECPLLFIPLCRAEVQSQRSKVMDNLQYQTFENDD